MLLAPAAAHCRWVHLADRNAVRAVEADPRDGALWYATDGGLVRLDPRAGVHQVFSRAEGLPAADLTSLLALPDGRLLAGSSDRGVLVGSGEGRWTAAGELDGVPHSHVYCLAPAAGAPGEALAWVGTLRGARRMQAGESFLEPARGSRTVLESQPVHDIFEEPGGGRTWFAAGNGLWSMDSAGAFQRWGPAEGLAALAMQAVEPGADGALYVSPGQGLWRLEGANFAPVTVPFGNRAIAALRRLEREGENLLAAAVDSTVYALDSEGSWSVLAILSAPLTALGPVLPGSGLPAAGAAQAGLFYPIAEGGYRNLHLPGPLHNLLTRVAVDSRGAVWTSGAAEGMPRSPAGVYRYDREGWTHYTEDNSPLTFNLVSSLNVAPDGRLYLGTWFGPAGVGSGGFDILDDRGSADSTDDRWERYTANETALSMDVIRGDIAFDSSGGAWIGSQFNQSSPGGLERFDPVTRQFVSFSASLVERAVRTVEVDGLGNVWIGLASRGLMVIPGGFAGGEPPRRVASFTVALGEVGVQDLAVDPANRLWIATDSKVVILNFQEDARDERKFAYREVKPPGQAGLAANAIALEGLTAAWFATRAGIWRLALPESTEDWTVFDRAGSALASDQVHDLALDPGRGVLWAATAAGLSGMELEQAQARVSGGRGKIEVSPNPWRAWEQPLLQLSGMPRYSRVTILTVAGEPVREYQPRELAAELLFWDGRNQQGRPVAPGVYLIHARAPGGREFLGKAALIR